MKVTAALIKEKIGTTTTTYSSSYTHTAYTPPCVIDDALYDLEYITKKQNSPVKAELLDSGWYFSYSIVIDLSKVGLSQHLLNKFVAAAKELPKQSSYQTATAEDAESRLMRERVLDDELCEDVFFTSTLVRSSTQSSCIGVVDLAGKDKTFYPIRAVNIVTSLFGSGMSFRRVKGYARRSATLHCTSASENLLCIKNDLVVASINNIYVHSY